ncbi:uncharacterized protein LOC126975693 [Leptidea sinapis]|uniref:uncharacterized protein LOC126975693 n=1 Tax=Leptidea sinapis TaxID=189913 RepID=UPI00212DBBFF|nr:uncharacterized protein LOC126975693 [Leptidea sinapis]
MDKLRPSPILLFNDKQMENVRKVFNYEDVNKLKQDLDNLEDWIRKQNHFVVKEFDRKYLERLLLSSKGSVEITKKRFDRLCTMRKIMPEMLKNIDMKNEFISLHKWHRYCVLPKPTSDNYRVIIASIYNPNELECIEFFDMYRYLVSMFYYFFNRDYNAGYEYIFDARNYTFGVVTKLNPLIMHKVASVFLEAIGVRLKCLHMISGSKLFDTILSFVKQALTEKLVKRIVIHDSVESLHKYISKEILPVDFQGDEKSIAELSEANFKELCTEEHIQFLKTLDKAETDESLRLSDKSDAEFMGMPGSFKTLSID